MFFMYWIFLEIVFNILVKYVNIDMHFICTICLQSTHVHVVIIYYMLFKTRFVYMWKIYTYIWSAKFSNSDFTKHYIFMLWKLSDHFQIAELVILTIPSSAIVANLWQFVFHMWGLRTLKSTDTLSLRLRFPVSLAEQLCLDARNWFHMSDDNIIYGTISHCAVSYFSIPCFFAGMILST